MGPAPPGLMLQRKLVWVFCLALMLGGRAWADIPPRLLTIWLQPGGGATLVLASQTVSGPIDGVVSGPLDPVSRSILVPGYLFVKAWWAPSAFAQDGWMAAGQVDTRRLEDGTECRVVPLYSHDVDIRVQGKAVSPLSLDEHTYVLPPGSTADVQYGYRWGDAWPLALVLCLPILLTAAACTWATDDAGGGFAMARLLQAVTSVERYVWWFALAWWGGKDLILFCFNLYPNAVPVLVVISGMVLFLPTTFVDLICRLVARPSWSRLIGNRYTVTDTIQYWLAGSLPKDLNWVLLVSGVGLITTHQTVPALICFAAYAGVGRLASRLGARLYRIGLAPRELRDRLLALAQKAGITLGRVLVDVTDKSPTPNAYALKDNNVMVTRTLLTSLSAREVDAVMAHEFAHLKHQHLRTSRIIIGVFMVGQYLLYRTFQLSVLDVSGLVIIAVVNSILSVILLVMSRRNETQADDVGYDIQGDGEAAITALIRVGRLNHAPWKWNSLDTMFWTHPSTRERVQRIAQRAGISDGRLEELRQQALAEVVTLQPQ